jgi:hypothetical protein
LEIARRTENTNHQKPGFFAKLSHYPNLDGVGGKGAVLLESKLAQPTRMIT